MESENMTESKKILSFLEILRNILCGKVLKDIVTKEFKMLFLIFFFIIFFISIHYICSKKLTEIDNLKKELVELQYEKVILTTRLTSISRQSKIEDLLMEKGSELSRNSENIYLIKK